MSRLEFKFIDDFRKSYIIDHFDESIHDIIINGGILKGCILLIILRHKKTILK